MREDDLKAQIDVVQSFVAQGVGGHRPRARSATRGSSGSVKAATDAHVPVVVFDSDLAGGDYVSFVATDNEAAGKTAGDALAAQVGKGNVVAPALPGGLGQHGEPREGLPRGGQGAPRRQARERLAVRRRHDRDRREGEREPARVAPGRRRAACRASSRRTSRRRSGCSSRCARRACRARCTSSASTPPTSSSQARRASGDIDGLVVQRPFDMGYLAVKTMVAHIRGAGRREAHRHRLDARHADNLDTPEVQALVKPDLKTWLGE